jgi:hypothetical protein
MANTTITALPPATTPLNGVEVVPIVQNGVTKKVEVSAISNNSGSAVADGCIYLYNQEIRNNYVIQPNKVGVSIGPITFVNGATVTVSSGSSYIVL